MPLNLAVLTHQSAETVQLPALYDAMCRAIAEAHRVDEVKDIRDKALAFEVYARQAQNTDAERDACQIRLRAERKAGELLRIMEKAKPTGSNQHKHRSSAPTDPPRLRELGISKDQASQWQRLADVPDDQFETALTDGKPSTAGIIASTTPPKPETIPVSAEALWLWGRLKDFERDGLLTKEPRHVLMTMTPAMLDEVHRLAPRVARWLSFIGR